MDKIEQLKKILCPEPVTIEGGWQVTNDPSYNLEGVISDIEAGIVDKLCIETLRRVQKQITQAQKVLTDD